MIISIGNEYSRNGVQKGSRINTEPERALEMILNKECSGVITEFIIPGAIESFEESYQGYLPLIKDDSTREILTAGHVDYDAVCEAAVQKIRDRQNDLYKAASTFRSRRQYARDNNNMRRQLGRNSGISEIMDQRDIRKEFGTKRFAYGAVLAKAAHDNNIPVVILQNSPKNMYDIEGQINYHSAFKPLLDRRIIKSYNILPPEIKTTGVYPKWGLAEWKIVNNKL